MPKVSVAGGELCYYEYGDGDPLLLVSGLGGAATYWSPQIDAFSHDYRVIAHDHRGTGQSTRSHIRYSVAQMSDDLLRLMDALSLERVHIVGHSTGGAIGITIAARYPDRVRSLVAYATWTHCDENLRRAMQARRRLLTSVGPEAYIESTALFLYPPSWVNENACALLQSEAKAKATSPDIEIAASRVDAVMAYDGREDLQHVRCPTLVLVAKDDILTPLHFSREIVGSIKGAELVVMRTGGHAASITHPSEFNQTVLAFLRRQ